MTGAFSNPLARGSSSIIAKTRTIKEWVRARLDLTHAAIVSVNELACTLPGCPPKETVILVMRDSRTDQVSIHKAISEVTEGEVGQALAHLIVTGGTPMR
ncbi:hypothetical protein N7E02_15505 [Aliirhizobium terrae]|uniref:hypothetical protein n=1 Tax=Terrirhizobium terrae TaxID=2926709 RepID=UPI002578BA2B|nr:hypothetical protein [Rhizobium sp. CC-CFT758]WJH41692.1 hypothetical protein N7E02_15505 [Rhizobium sp. CC-CFT758]